MRGHNMITKQRTKLFLIHLPQYSRQRKPSRQFHFPSLHTFLLLVSTSQFSAHSSACNNTHHQKRVAISAPNRFALSKIIKQASRTRTSLRGRSLHGFVLIGPSESRDDVFVGAALVEMYARFGEMGSARRVFEEYSEPDVGLWTSLVSGYLRNDDAHAAITFFSTMVMERGALPNAVTLTCLASALGILRDFYGGKCCHGFVLRNGFDWDVALLNSLLNMYAKMGAMDYARKLFDVMPKRDAVTWSSMVVSHAHNGMPEEALKFYKSMMLVSAGVKPNHVTVTGALQACALSSNLEEGRRIHKVAVSQGFFASRVAVRTALLDMYMKCGRCKEALSVFIQIPEKDVVAWGALIGGYVRNGLPNEALEAFVGGLLVSSVGTRPDAVVIVKALRACSQLGILHQATCLHGLALSIGFANQVFVGAALVDVYSKCGCLESAVEVFRDAVDKDVVIWSSIIAAYGIHGLGRTSILMFESMVVESSVRPNNITFIALLSACSHSGLVDDGRKIFIEMSSIYGIEPCLEHYTILIDLLGRAGKLQEAMELIEQMPRLATGPHTWCALLAGCRIHGNINIGLLAAKNLLELDGTHSGYYLLLSNIYASDQKWDAAAKTLGLAKKYAQKVQGYSSIAVDGGVFLFLSNERSHEHFRRLHHVLRNLQLSIKEEAFFKFNGGVYKESGQT